MGVVYTAFRTEFGWCAVAKSSRGLARIFLPFREKKVLEEKIREMFPSALESFNELSVIREALQQYFRGHNPDLGFKLDLKYATDFQKKVWEEAKKIPYGQTTFYSWIAKKLKKGGAFRAVGSALGKNPFPIIVPCHRVLRKTGDLGGFSALEGVDMKRRLLMLEGNQYQ